ncbi:hypothetical protein [Streptomyces liangshanensis]|uniref:hypothetical protein n=1 Tax=Streptomyces liangshanensis TaxID=2717324 RepID=UPI0036DEA6E5
MSNRESETNALILDVSAQLEERIAALRRIAVADPEAAIEVGIRVTENLGEAPIALTSVGRELARIASNHRWLTEFEVRNMDDSAFEAYCEHLS